MDDPTRQSVLALKLPDAQATDTLGAALAQALPGTEACAVLTLRGELGTGKTSCARGLLRQLGVSGLVRSPTYTLVEIYATVRLTCVHVDLYRLQGPADLEALGLRDFLAPGHLLVIEWPEHGGAQLPAADLELILENLGAGRAASLRAQGARGREWLGNLARDSRLIPYLSNIT